MELIQDQADLPFDNLDNYTKCLSLITESDSFEPEKKTHKLKTNNRKRKKVSRDEDYCDKQLQQLQLLQAQLGSYLNQRVVQEGTAVPGYSCVLPAWEDIEYIEQLPTAALLPVCAPLPLSPIKKARHSESKSKTRCQAKTLGGAMCTHFAKVGTKACGLLEHKAQLGEISK